VPGAVAVPGTVVAAAPVVKRTIYGRVTDVDKDGEVTVKTDGGKFEIRLTPDTVRQIRKGDAVMIDATFAPPGTQVR
jgi:ribosome maturation protein Sdo1